MQAISAAKTAGTALMLLSLFALGCASQRLDSESGARPLGFTGDNVPAVGSDQGRFQLSSSGGASYTIEVQVPPGIRTFDPALSFAYSSKAQNGLMGMGWNLNGFARISRVKKILAIDGVAGAISLSNEDRFALNGRRLLVMNGENGAEQSVYRNEIDTWQQTTISAADSYGPTTFQVQHPNGVVQVFGGTTDSRLMAADEKTVREWLLSSSTDKNGNTITYTYDPDPLKTGQTTSQAYPVEIAYGSNSSTTPETSADRFVRFTYQSRNDVVQHMQAGTEIQTSARLAAVNTYVEDSLVSNYRVSYSSSAASERSLVSSIQRFSALDDTMGISPSSFTYQQGSNAFGGADTWLSGNFTPASGWDKTDNPIKLADVNGDGLLDLVGFKDGVQVALGKQDGFATATTWIDDFSLRYNWSSDEPRYLADINGDGVADIVGFSDDGVVFALADPASSRFQLVAGNFPYFAPNNGWLSGAPRLLADVNGDKAVDIVGFSNNVTVALANLNGGFERPLQWLPGFGVEQGWAAEDLLLSDVNGDGKSDVVAMNQTTRTVSVALSTGSNFDRSGWDQSYSYFADNTEWNDDNPRMMADVNGDGLSDLVGFGTDVQVGISNGAGFEVPVSWSNDFGAPNWTSEQPRMMTDVNGDGRSDIVAVSDGGVQVALSDGRKFVPDNWNQNSLDQLGLSQGGTTSETRRLVVDVNADGMLDMLAITQNDIQVGLVSGVIPDLMNGVTRPAMGKLAIQYKNLSDPSVYSEPAGEGALARFQSFRPLEQNPQLPVYRANSRLTGRYYVVSQTTKTNNPAIADAPFTYTTTHRYTDAEVSNYGRGWMGFGSSTHNNESLGRITTLTYNQSSPYVGLPTSRKVSCGTPADQSCNAGDIFHLDTLSYIASTTATSGSTGYEATMVKRSFVRSDNYQSGRYMHSVGRRFSYDQYGNPVQISTLNLVDESGRDLDPADNVYRSSSYLNDESTWRLGFKQYVKLSSSSSMSELGAYSNGTDFSLNSWTYDNSMNVASANRWDDTLSRFVGKAFTHDDFGNELVVTRTGGASTTYTVEERFNTYRESRTRITDATGASLVDRYGYDARNGRRSLHVDPNGNLFALCYDDLGRRSLHQGPVPDNATATSTVAACPGTMVTMPTGITLSRLVNLTSYAYNWVNGVPTRQVTLTNEWEASSNGGPVVNTYFFDGLEREYQMQSQPFAGGSNKRIMSFRQFDAQHNTLASTLPYFDGEVDVLRQTMEYDPLGRMVQTSSPWQTNGAVEMVNDTRQHITTSTGRTVVAEAASGTPHASQLQLEKSYYNGKARVAFASYTDGTGSAASNALQSDYSRDLLGRMLSLVPPGGAADTTASYTYDSLNRIRTKTLPSLGDYNYSYDANGWLVSRDQANGSVSFTRDLIGRATKTSYPGDLVITRDYDQSGVSNGMERLGAASVSGQAVPVVRSYDYNAYGYASSSVLSLDNGSITMQQRSTYDPLGRRTGLTLPSGRELSFAYDNEVLSSQKVGGKSVLTMSDFTASGMPGNIAYGSGTKTTLAYAPNFTISSLAVENGDKVLFTENYERDPYGFPTSVNGSSGNWGSYSKSADFEARRLVSAQDSRQPSAESFSYDSLGTLLTTPDLAVTPSGYRIGEGSTYKGSDLEADYGSMGELQSVSAGELAFNASYDGRNRTASFQAAGAASASSFAYDHTGFRVWRQDAGGDVTAYHSYLYQQSGNADSGKLTLYSATGPAYYASQSSELYLHNNDRHSLEVTTDSSGVPQEWYTYSVTGTPAGRTALSPPYGFMGRMYDDDTGLYYLHKRYYSPTLARFMTADTRYTAGVYRHDSPNRYSLLLNNPAWGFDPSGHGLPGCIAASGGGVFGLISGVSQIVDGAIQHNTLSALGVGGGASVAGSFAVAAGISACKKYLLKRARQGGGDGDGDGAGGDGDGMGHDGADDSDDDSGGNEFDGSESAGDDSDAGASDGDDSTDNDSSADDESDDGDDADDEGTGDDSSDDESDSDGSDSSTSDDDSDGESQGYDEESYDGHVSSDSLSDAGGASDSEIGSSGVEMDSLSTTSSSSSSSASASSSASTAALDGEGAGLESSASSLTGGATGEIAGDGSALVAGDAVADGVAATVETGTAVAAGETAAEFTPFFLILLF